MAEYADHSLHGKNARAGCELIAYSCFRTSFGGSPCVVSIPSSLLRPAASLADAQTDVVLYLQRYPNIVFEKNSSRLPLSPVRARPCGNART
jgi:hypothetical protein